MFTNSLAIGLVVFAQISSVMPMSVVAATQVTTLPAPIPPTTRPVTRPVTRPPSRPDFRVPYYSRSNYIDGRGFAGRIRCNSQNGRFNSCSARTQNRVMLVRTHGGDCRRGHSWGYDQRRIWVSQSCRATFAYGFGHYYPDRNNSSSSNSTAAWVIGGVAVAAGLAAILSNSGRKIDTSTAQAGPPATISADPNWVQEAARPALSQCLSRAARDVGATGGTRITLQTAAASEIEPGVFQIGGTLTAQYPDSTRELPMLCEASATVVDQFEFES